MTHPHKILFASPDAEVNPKGFSRTLAKRCPWCGDYFFAYERVEAEKTPGLTDPDLAHGFGLIRETCGDPNCWGQEDEYQFKKRVEWRKNNSHNAETIVTKTRRNVL